MTTLNVSFVKAIKFSLYNDRKLADCHNQNETQAQILPELVIFIITVLIIVIIVLIFLISGPSF